MERDIDIIFEMKATIDNRRVYVRIFADHGAEVYGFDNDGVEDTLDRGRWTGRHFRDFTHIPREMAAEWAAFARHVLREDDDTHVDGAAE